MADPFVAQCPSCDAKLRLKPAMHGKRVRCPKCSTVFAAAASRKTVDEWSGEDEFFSDERGSDSDDGGTDDVGSNDRGSSDGGTDDEFGESEPVARPGRSTQQLPGRINAPRAPRPTTKSKALPPEEPKREKKKSINKTVVIAAGCAAFFVAMGVSYFAVTAMFGGRYGMLGRLSGSSGNTINLQYLPDRPEAILCIRVAALWNSAAAQAAQADSSFQKIIEMYANAIGMRPQDVDTVTLAIAATSNLRGAKVAAGLAQLKGVSGEDSSSQTRVVVILRTKIPIDRKQLAKAVGGKVALEWGEYTRVDGVGAGLNVFRPMEATAVFFPDDKTMVMGSVLTIDEIKANQSQTQYIPELSVVDPKHHVILAVLPRNWPRAENLVLGRDDGPLGAMIRRMSGALWGKEKINVIAFNFGKGVTLRYIADCESPKDAAARQKDVQDDIESGQDSGMDVVDLLAPPDKKKAEPPKVHLNPLNVFYDFRPAGRQKDASLSWSEINGTTIEFVARLKGETAIEEAGQALTHLAFYFPKPKERRFGPRNQPLGDVGGGDADE